MVGQAEKRPLSSSQIRAARALVNWSAQDLARHSSVSLRTIRRAELGDRQTSMTAPNDLAIRRAFELAGVEFIDENGGGPGVRYESVTKKELGLLNRTNNACESRLQPRINEPNLIRRRKMRLESKQDAGRAVYTYKLSLDPQIGHTLWPGTHREAK